ncbi:MAG TPA: response regulator [Bacteroidales bacterium]|nr:response regulator [Bacteroidales bacterium]
MVKQNILIVDDSETNLVLLEAILEDDGFNVKTAYSVKEAEQTLKSYTPELILLDLLMPNENGFDLLRKLKANDRFKNIPIIIVTAFANLENKVIAKDLGAADVIEKPINIPDFIEKVYNALDENK